MSVRMWVTTAPASEVEVMRTEHGQTLEVLGAREDKVALQLQEVVSSVTDAVAASLQTEAELTVEINGALELKGQGGVSYLFFNVGGSATNAQSMKVTLKTKIQPRGTGQLNRDDG